MYLYIQDNIRRSKLRKERTNVSIERGLYKELKMWHEAYGFSITLMVSKAIRYMFSYPSEVLGVTENKFLNSGKNHPKPKVK